MLKRLLRSGLILEPGIWDLMGMDAGARTQASLSTLELQRAVYLMMIAMSPSLHRKVVETGAQRMNGLPIFILLSSRV